SNSLKSLRMVTFLQRTFTSLVHTHAGRTQSVSFSNPLTPTLSPRERELAGQQCFYIILHFLSLLSR
ncbi:MAG: hypothetical protein KZQ78_18680, partial [Candidatus Thiodiazotropha sp. (ex Ustalcina ferruginea)]|nr:hypothetical protein [Candidatus Thiodiazotropha sp. (ex Ustalcina ferruginea)]